eukprot:Rmarinus@m.2219
MTVSGAGPPLVYSEGPEMDVVLQSDYEKLLEYLDHTKKLNREALKIVKELSPDDDIIKELEGTTCSRQRSSIGRLSGHGIHYHIHRWKTSGAHAATHSPPKKPRQKNFPPKEKSAPVKPLPAPSVPTIVYSTGDDRTWLSKTHAGHGEERRKPSSPPLQQTLPPSFRERKRIRFSRRDEGMRLPELVKRLWCHVERARAIRWRRVSISAIFAVWGKKMLRSREFSDCGDYGPLVRDTLPYFAEWCIILKARAFWSLRRAGWLRRIQKRLQIRHGKKLLRTLFRAWR